jgi:hypothetical protein
VVRPSRTEPAATSTGLPWSRTRTALRVRALLARLPAADPEKRVLEARVRAYSRECGCAWAGAFLAASMVVAALYGVAGGNLTVRTAAASALFVLLATLLGKGTGLLHAWVRLILLQRKLSRRLNRGGGHVYVH